MATVTKTRMVATEAKVGKKVYLGADLEASEKVQSFVDENQGKSFEILEVGNYKSKLDGVPFKVSHKNIYEMETYEEEVKKPKPTQTIDTIIKTHICEQIFQNGYPTELDNKHPFDFFIEADVVGAECVDESPLGTEWDFEVASEYDFDTIRTIRGLMQSMYSEMQKLKDSLFQYATKPMQLNKDECINDDVFYELVQEGQGTLYRQGTADEYANILTVSTEAIS